MTKIEKTQVVIVGGGITGLAAALFLSKHGINFILLEKHIGTSIYPRARTIDVRTMEIFRGMGMANKLREGGKDLAPAWGILRGSNLLETLDNPTAMAEKLTPGQLMTIQKEMKDLAEKSPEGLCRCTQDISEAILYANAEAQGLDLRFYHQSLSFDQLESIVEVSVQNRHSEELYTIHADYMIAADGANSMVRQKLNVPTYGNIAGTDLLNIYFEADLENFVKGRAFSQFLVESPEITGFLLTINNKDRWAFHLRYNPAERDTIADYPEDRLIGILRRILGLPEIRITILKVLPWQLTVRIAESIRSKRIFLAGDAAHTMTPYAGKGANAGIQDSQNLAWKMALVLKNLAGDALLDTYHAERQPVGAYYAKLSGELAKENGLIDDILMLSKGKDLMGLPNYGYYSTAVSRPSALPLTCFSGEPGTRIPHLWLNEAMDISSLDWVKGQFVLIANQRMVWETECQQILKELGVNINVIIPEDANHLQEWKKLTHTHDDEALLIRPDDFVAAKLVTGNLSVVFRSLLGR